MSGYLDSLMIFEFECKGLIDSAEFTDVSYCYEEITVTLTGDDTYTEITSFGNCQGDINGPILGDTAVTVTCNIHRFEFIITVCIRGLCT